MAKRKKKQGGGAFGGGGKSGPSAASPSLDSLMSPRESGRMMKTIQKIMASRDFESEEEMQRFFQENLIGKLPEELEAMLPDDEPQTDLERADSLIEGIPEGARPREIARIAKQALAISEDCMGAWLELGVSAEDPDTALEYFEKGIERGRGRFKDLIEDAGEERGLWGYIDARDFMRMLEEKARILVGMTKLEQAVEVYQEMLALNPNDNQGIRGELLRLLLIFRRLDETHKLLDSYPNDAMVDMAYGRAFLEIMEAIERSGFEVPDIDAPGAPKSPPALLKRLGPEFDAAKKLLNHAVKVNPFVPLFMTHGSILEVEVGDMASFGGPYEAVVYSQKWCALWFITDLPFLILEAASPNNLKKLAKSSLIAEELLDVIDQLEALDSLGGLPWWREQPRKG